MHTETDNKRSKRMSYLKIFVLTIFLLSSFSARAQMNHDHHHHHGMSDNNGGFVMNENVDILPNGCDAIRSEKSITVYASKKYATGVPGTVYGMSDYEWNVEPCSRITVTFINEDNVRHMWMIHELPKYLYPAGMFHIEALGGKSQTGTFITPSENKNYLVHCDMSQHMEMGMRGQIIVGKGSGDLWSVTGITDHLYRASYLPQYIIFFCMLASIFGYILNAKLVKKGRKG